MSRNIVFEGWLTKSPPAKRIWRAKWRRRWFSLRQSSELPGQYFLDYYADRNCRRLKGTIDLDLCEQVDAGLRMERGNSALDSKTRGSGFTIRTQSRTYYLEADCEADMGNWVDTICRVCGLRSTEESNEEMSTYQANLNSVAAMNVRYNRANNTGPYIPISECITGSRLQEMQRTLNLNSENAVASRRMSNVGSARGNQMYMSQPQIRLNGEISEDSNLSEEDCKSLNASQCNIGEWSVAKSFTKLAVTPTRNGFSEDGPPVPPRPLKTLTKPREYYSKDAFQGPKIQEPMVTTAEIMKDANRWLQVPGRPSHSRLPTSPGRMPLSLHRYTDDEDENLPGCPSPTYLNMANLPPAVDRALKPRHSSHSFGHINNLLINKNFARNGTIFEEEPKRDVLQYLDLDLHSSKPPSAKPQDVTSKRNSAVIHGKSLSAVEGESAYKTVDFMKTEALNITRLDTEASRSLQY